MPAKAGSSLKARKAREKNEEFTAAEQSRGVLESSQGRNSKASVRGRMVEIGRGKLLARREQVGGRKGK